MIARYGLQHSPVVKFLQWDGSAWNGLMRHDPAVGTVTADQDVVGRISWFGCEANDLPKCRRYTAADNQAYHDQGYGWTCFITIREYLSEAVLVRSCTVALFHWYRCRWCHSSPLLLSSYRYIYPLPYTTYPPPPTTAILLFLTSSSLTSLTDLMYHPPPPPQLFLSILLLTRYTLLS